MRLNQKVGDMDSIYLFLLIAFAMGAKAFVESFKKKADELESESERTTYLDEDDFPELHFPEGEQTIHPVEPTASPVQTIMPSAETARPTKATPQSTWHKPQANPRKQKNRLRSLHSCEGERSTAQTSVTPPLSETEEKPLELATGNIEEIRKAIIWSEILHPKYR